MWNNLNPNIQFWAEKSTKAWMQLTELSELETCLYLRVKSLPQTDTPYMVQAVSIYEFL